MIRRNQWKTKNTHKPGKVKKFCSLKSELDKPTDQITQTVMDLMQTKEEFIELARRVLHFREWINPAVMRALIADINKLERTQNRRRQNVLVLKIRAHVHHILQETFVEAFFNESISSEQLMRIVNALQWYRFSECRVCENGISENKQNHMKNEMNQMTKFFFFFSIIVVCENNRWNSVYNASAKYIICR